MKILTCRWQITVKNWWNLPINNPKPDLHDINALTEFGENPFILTRKIRKDGRTYDRRIAHLIQYSSGGFSKSPREPVGLIF